MATGIVLDNTTLELALEGERLCKLGDFRSGIAFFEAAIQAGCDDLKTLSAIYSQLGNAYFYIGDYGKAMNFHKHDLTLARTMGDKLGEAKASGNLGNTLKVMGKFDEAIICCGRHLEITTKLQDKIGQARAFYNLANAYHSKGKHVGKNGEQDPGEYPEDVKLCLIKAVELYQSNLDLTQELNDKNGEGRACGNLGNVHYLLGNFEEAITFHERRLEIAKEFGDQNAQKRAYTNLGNAQVFSGNFEIAVQYYKKSLGLSEELGDRIGEAQTCFSLGNTYTLLRDYPKAIEYHLMHLQIAQQLNDRVGEGRAFWSLGNAYSAMGEHRQALLYAKRHLVVAKELNDTMAQTTAEMNVADLRKVLGFLESGDEDEEGEAEEVPAPKSPCSPDSNSSHKSSVPGSRRKSMEEMNLIRMTPEAAATAAKSRQNPSTTTSGLLPSNSRSHRSLSLGHVLFHHKGNSQNSSKSNSASSSTKNLLSASKPHQSTEADDEEGDEQDDFFDLLTKCQAGRMDDQRCTMPNNTMEETIGNFKADDGTYEQSGPSCSKFRPPFVTTGSFNQQHHSNLRMLGTNKENNDKRNKTLPGRANSLPIGPAFISKNKDNVDTSGSDDLLDLIWGMQSKRMDEQRACLPDISPDDDKFFDMLIRCQGSRLEDQRSVLPLDDCEGDGNGGNGTNSNKATQKSRGPTVPDEDFFSLIARLQEGRMDDQRADIKDKNRNRIN